MSDAVRQHQKYAPESISVNVLTVSDSRTIDDDKSGALVCEQLIAAGHTLAERAIVKDSADEIRTAVLRGIRRADVDCVIVTGGTGVSPRDVTPDAIEPLFERTLAGYGELFRTLSHSEIGAAAMLSRAIAGTAGRTVIFVTPGSSAAVKLAMTALILPEVKHIVGQLRRSAAAPASTG